MSQIDLLYRLQQIDNELRQTRKRLTEVLALQKEDARLLAARDQAEKTAAEAARWQRVQREQEQELAALRQELLDTQTRLYSGTVRNPKELGDLERKIEALKRRLSVHEDSVLEAMVAHEEADAAAEDAAEVLAAIEAERAAKSVRWRQEQHDLALALDDWMTRRQALAPRIEASLMTEYDRTAQRRGGVAVAGLKGDVCLGCQVRVPAHLVTAAKHGEVARCGSCGRILNPI